MYNNPPPKNKKIISITQRKMVERVEMVEMEEWFSNKVSLLYVFSCQKTGFFHFQFQKTSSHVVTATFSLRKLP